MPGTNSPDPNFGKCLQCAAIDRARYNASPPLPLSTFCQTCFAQYCFDPNNLTSAAQQLPGRKLAFVDPDLEGVDAVSGFLNEKKIAIYLGSVGAALLIAAVCVFLCAYALLRSSPLIMSSSRFILEYGGDGVGLGCAQSLTKR